MTVQNVVVEFEETILNLTLKGEGKVMSCELQRPATPQRDAGSTYSTCLKFRQAQVMGSFRVFSRSEVGILTEDLDMQEYPSTSQHFLGSDCEQTKQRRRVQVGCKAYSAILAYTK